MNHYEKRYITLVLAPVLVFAAVAVAPLSATSGSSTGGGTEQVESNSSETDVNQTATSRQESELARINDLAEQNDEQAVVELGEILQMSPYRKVKVQSLIALGQIKDQPAGVEKLLQAAKTSGDSVVQYAALASLWRLETDENRSRIHEVASELAGNSRDERLKGLAASYLEYVDQDKKDAESTSDDEDQATEEHSGDDEEAAQ